jgi:hypothetical protein
VKKDAIFLTFETPYLSMFQGYAQMKKLKIQGL